MKHTDIMETIKELKEMFFAGAISEEEFQRLKMEFLEKMNLLPNEASNEAPTQADLPSSAPASVVTGRSSIPSRRSTSDPFIPKAKTSGHSSFVEEEDGISVVRGVPLATSTPVPNSLPSARQSSEPFVQKVSSTSGSSAEFSSALSGLSHEDRKQQFMTLYTKATQQAADEPGRALRFMEEARVLAPELVDDVFRQWMQYANYMLRQRREEEEAQKYRSHSDLYKVEGENSDPIGFGTEPTNPGFAMAQSVASSPPIEKEEEDPVSILLEGVNDLLGEEDYEGAIVLLEHLRQEFPHLEQIKSLYNLCREKLEVDYEEKYEMASSVFPALTCSTSDLIEMKNKMDYRVGFLISQIDGTTSLSELVMLTGLEEFEVYRIIEKLEERGVLDLTQK